MSKPKMDLEMFWSLPRGMGDLEFNGKYCALGAALKSVGLNTYYSCIPNLDPSWTGSYLNEHPLNTAWKINDDGEVDKAKRMVLEYLVEKDLVEFTEDPLIYKPRELTTQVSRSTI